ncbi:hypothetical protein GCM10009819_15670 [Agromyces tropicus]|uniref:Uncharacterized protein n=1 Tax=Agromyces tropicus TaxID=555371 RepID=A0ABN2UAL7_9MICO
MQALATITRTWPMLAALGGGLVLTALGAGAGGAPRVVLAGLGVAALGWGACALRAGRVLAPRATLATAVGLLVLGGAAAAAGALAMLPGAPVAAAAAFVAVVALSAATMLRADRRRREDPAPAASVGRNRSPGGETARSLTGLAAGAILVSALATPALAATEAGRSAAPHGEHVIAPADRDHHH